jgi:hypothetical protein
MMPRRSIRRLARAALVAAALASILLASPARQIEQGDLAASLCSSGTGPRPGAWSMADLAAEAGDPIPDGPQHADGHCPACLLTAHPPLPAATPTSVLSPPPCLEGRVPRPTERFAAVPSWPPAHARAPPEAAVQSPPNRSA